MFDFNHKKLNSIEKIDFVEYLEQYLDENLNINQIEIKNLLTQENKLIKDIHQLLARKY